jgi:hypothetical protein
MNKDFDLKNDPAYRNGGLRGRIDAAIKRERDDAEELDQPTSKTMPMIPVTGGGKSHKYFNNKSGKAY